MIDLPGLEGVDEVRVTEEAVTSSEAAPLMIYSETKKDSSL